MSQQINLQLDTATLEISPGESVDVRATITNASDVVDAYGVMVTGLDPSWYRLSTDEVRLFPKGQAEVVITINVPVIGGPPAGMYAGPIVVTSRNNAQESTAAVLTLTLRATGDFALGLEPPKLVGREGVYAVHVTNPGNSPVATVLEATDPEERLQYTFGAPKTQGLGQDALLQRQPLGKAQAKRDGHIAHEIEVPAHSIVTVPMHVTPSKRIWIGNGREMSLSFVVGAHPPGIEWEPKEAKKVGAELSYKPVFGVLAALPMGMRRALGIGIPLLILGLLIMLLVTRTMQAQNNAANATATQTAAINSANATQTALAAAGKGGAGGAGGSPAMQTAQAVAANANATQTAVAAANGGDGLEAAIASLGGALFINEFRLKVPSQSEAVPVRQPNFVWDVTSAENVRITQTTRSLIIPKMETSKLVDYNLNAKGSNFVITNKSSVLFVRPPAIEILAGNPLTVTLGQTTTLSWKVKAANAGLMDRVTVDLGPEGEGQIVEAPTMTRRYILCAANATGNSCQAIKIWVVEGGSGSGENKPTGSCAVAAVDIAIKGANFSTKELVVGVGSTVRWVNQDGIPHNLESATGAGGTPVNNPLAPNNAYQYTFPAPGRYTYQLASDPTKFGTIVVLPPCTATPTLTPTRLVTGTRTNTPLRTATPPKAATATFTPTKPAFTPTRTFTRGPVFTPTRTPTAEPTGYVPGDPILPNPCVVGLANVAMQSIAYLPRRIVVYAGTTVRWSNRDTVSHTSTSDTAIWNSNVVPPNGTFDFRFNNVGGFPYHCNVHPGMKGIVVVIPPCALTPTNTVAPRTLTSTPTPRPPAPPSDTPIPPPTREPTREPTWTREPTRAPTWTREPTREPTWTRAPSCPPLTVSISAGLSVSVDPSGNVVVNVSWDSTGGCAPYSGSITGAYAGSAPHYNYTVNAPSGSDNDYPPQPPSGNCTIRYSIILNDNSGLRATNSVSIQSPWCGGTPGVEVPTQRDFPTYVGETCDVSTVGQLYENCVLEP